VTVKTVGMFKPTETVKKIVNDMMEDKAYQKFCGGETRMSVHIVLVPIGYGPDLIEMVDEFVKAIVMGEMNVPPNG
jgi:hypothetical protein